MTNGRFNPSARLLLIFGAASLTAVGVGAVVCAAGGVPTGSWARNLAAWLIGALAAAGMAATVRFAVLTVVPWLAVAGLAATFFNPAQDGVHRWIDAGPLHVNVAMVVLPCAAVALAMAADRWTIWVAAFAALVLLVAQPDASQATALAGVIALVAAVRLHNRSTRAVAIVGAGLLAILAWIRPDPLQPVAEVEEIVGMAFGLSPALGGLTLIAQIAFVAVPAVLSRSDDRLRLGGGALSLCLALWVVTPMFGAFPIPLVGVGMSPILGAWLGVGLLAALHRRPPPSPARP
ncbi:MAG: hypothetical protein ACK4M2_01115 [Brevundimonas sp.]